MTENEKKEARIAIEHLKVGNISEYHIKIAIQAIEKVQKYEAIGTVEECEEAMKLHRAIQASVDSVLVEQAAMNACRQLAR